MEKLELEPKCLTLVLVILGGQNFIKEIKTLQKSISNKLSLHYSYSLISLFLIFIPEAICMNLKYGKYIDIVIIGLNFAV